MDGIAIRRLIAEGQRPLHAVCSIKQNPEVVLLITVYDPSKHPARWMDTDAEGSGPMGRTYHSCHFCGGEVIVQRVTVDYRWGNELLAVVRNVPAGVCQTCGEQYLKSEVVKELERVAHAHETPAKILRVPVRELKAA